MRRRRMFSRIAGALLVLSLMSMTSDEIRADTVVIPVFGDTTLSEAAPGNNMGGNTQILAGTDGLGRSRRGLLAFDVASDLPAGAIIQSAALYLTVTSANPAAGDFSLHRVLAAWGEGAGNGSAGAAAMPGEATWHSRLHGAALWNAPGGLVGVDYVATSSSTTHVSAAGEYAFTELAADVQWMVDNPANNFGWMLISEREGIAQTARQFIASETGNASVPRLEIEYSVIPEPAALLVAISGVVLACGRKLRPCALPSRRNLGNVVGRTKRPSSRMSSRSQRTRDSSSANRASAKPRCTRSSMRSSVGPSREPA
jgi:hypothetical protein